MSNVHGSEIHMKAFMMKYQKMEEALEHCKTAFCNIQNDKDFEDFEEKDFKMHMKCSMFLSKSMENECEEALSFDPLNNDL